MGVVGRRRSHRPQRRRLGLWHDHHLRRVAEEGRSDVQRSRRWHRPGVAGRRGELDQRQHALPGTPEEHLRHAPRRVVARRRDGVCHVQQPSRRRLRPRTCTPAPITARAGARSRRIPAWSGASTITEDPKNPSALCRHRIRAVRIPERGAVGQGAAPTCRPCRSTRSRSTRATTTCSWPRMGAVSGSSMTCRRAARGDALAARHTSST